MRGAQRIRPWHAACSVGRDMSKILVAEDDAALLGLLESVLLEEGHEVWTAGDGEVALELAVVAMPDLLVTDLLMPGLDGYELMSRLRESADTDEIPVLVLSEHHNKDARLTAFRLGCDGFLPKPFELEEFRLRVAQTLRAHRDSSTRLAAAGVTMRGCLGQVALPSVLTLLEMDRQSGVLELRSDDLHARLFLECGRVVHAEALSDPSAEAFDVVCRALRARHGKFAVSADDVHVADHLGLPLTQLLLDAYRRIDEEDAQKAGA